MTPVDITNLALTNHLGEREITDFDEGTTAARAAKRNYDQARRATLQMSDWTFARRKVQAAPVANDYEERWPFAYALPHDLLKVTRIRPPVDPLQNPRPVPFEVRGGTLYTLLGPAVLEYTADLTDTVRFHPAYVDLLSLDLAIRICRPVTKSGRLLAELREQWPTTLSLAVSADANNELTTYWYESDYTLDRR